MAAAAMQPPKEVVQDIHFPKAGLHTADAFGRQPNRPVGRGPGQYVRTTADNQNVVSYDPVLGRDRGGSRGGLSKYNPTSPFTPSVDLGDTWVIQELSVFATTNSGVPAVQQSLFGRVNYILAVSAGKVKYMLADDVTWTATVNNTGEEPELNISGVMQSSPNNQLMFFVDGTNYVYYKPTTNSVERWTPTAGSLPRDSENNGARLITTWRGRTVLSGLLRDPQNWFMSKISDPFNFEYGSLPSTAADAEAGNNSQLGLIGDVVTALISYTDDILIFGGDHTIYAMRGDPLNGGQIDLVSDITGIAPGKAWCKDPYGNVYFFGNRPSVWRMTGAQQPERISNPIEPLLADIDSGSNIITMAWNDRQQSVEIFVTPIEEPGAATHFTWEYRTNSWAKRVFGNNDLNPLCVATYDGNQANDRVVLLGGWDGYVRYLDPEATTDDGTAISSYVLLGPILTPIADEMLLKEIQFILGESSGDITWEILSASTAEAALAAAASVSGTASGGRNGTQPVRVADHAIYIKISSTNRWAMESVRAVFKDTGRVRQRKPR